MAYFFYQLSEPIRKTGESIRDKQLDMGEAKLGKTPWGKGADRTIMIRHSLWRLRNY